MHSGGGTATVLAVFRRTCYWQLDGTAVCLGCRFVPPGPTTVVLDTSVSPATLWQAGETVKLCRPGAWVSDRGVTVNMSGAGQWQPTWPPAHAAPPAVLPAAVMALWDFLIHRAAEAGKSSPFQDVPRQFRSGPMHGSVADLWSALCSLDEVRLASAVENLLGLGPGLTPSGDDLLAGLLAATGWAAPWHPAPRRFRTVLVDTIVSAAPRYTHVISRSYLEAAAEGWLGAAAMEVAAAAFHGPVAAVVAAAHRALRYGHTSGFDGLTGIALGLDWAIRHRRRNPQ